MEAALKQETSGDAELKKSHDFKMTHEEKRRLEYGMRRRDTPKVGNTQRTNKGKNWLSLQA